MKTHHFVSSVFGLFFLAACTTTVTEPGPSTPSPPPGNNTPAPKPNEDDKTNLGTPREALNFTSPCTAGACGEVPSSSKSSTPSCSPSPGGGSCGWSDPNPDDVASYAPCEESKCGTKPTASVCPAGTTFKGASCGNENEKGCAWHSACVPPPSTTPCKDPNAAECQAKPEIGVICKDGSTGDLECMQLSTGKCGWQRTCE